MMTSAYASARSDASTRLLQLDIEDTEIAVSVSQFLDRRRELLVGRLQFLLGGLELFVRALVFLVRRQHLFVRRLEFLLNRSVLLDRDSHVVAQGFDLVL